MVVGRSENAHRVEHMIKGVKSPGNERENKPSDSRCRWGLLGKGQRQPSCHLCQGSRSWSEQLLDEHPVKIKHIVKETTLLEHTSDRQAYSS
eukprot:scaffold54644_cov20-Tisochrysis_lutea.AAC.1